MIKGRLFAKADGEKIRVYFIQRGDASEEPNLPVRVYRRPADEINFSTGMCGDDPGHWTEYVDNQKYSDERVSMVFDGTLPSKNSFCYYLDEDVSMGHTYLYWVTQQSAQGEIVIGPTACKLRDPDVWWSYDRSISEMEQLAREFPALVQTCTYGESTMHRKLMGLQIGNPDRTLLVAGAIHASEPGPEIILKAVRFILESRPELLDKLGMRLFPTVNVDVREQTVQGEPFYLRKNANGVDLNRNFDWDWREEFVYGFSNSDPESSTYHGPYPASENETRAAIRFVQESVHPQALFVFDSNSVITEDHFLFGSEPGEACWDRDNELANIYSHAFRENHEGCGTFTAEPMHYPKKLHACFDGTGQPHGTFEGWVHHEYQIPAYSLQTAYSKEGLCNSTDTVSLERLNQWARRHAYALIAILEEFSKKETV